MEPRHDDGPRMGQCYPCGVANQDGLPLATYPQRFVAVTIDWIMCLAVASRIPLAQNQGKSFLPLGLFFLEVFLLTLLQGASAGQRIMKLKVIRSDTGQPLSMRMIAIRTLLICMVFPVIFVVNRRGYHDRMCRSVVIRAIAVN